MVGMDKYLDALAGMFTDSRFREFRKYCYVGSVDGAKIGVVVATKTPKYDSFALNKASVEKMIASKRSGKVTEAFMVAASVGADGACTFAAFRDLEEFYATLLQKRLPRASEYGEFWVLRDLIVIKIAADGEVTTRPEGFEPTEEEAAAIKEALATIAVPKWTPGSEAGSNTLRRRLDVAREDWFEILDPSRTKVVMCQQRVKTESGKAYLPWSLWNDMEWRRMEPDVDGLPMWKPKTKALLGMVMVHEGAKAARHADWLVNDTSYESRQARAKHPWGADLSCATPA